MNARNSGWRSCFTAGLTVAVALGAIILFLAYVVPETLVFFARKGPDIAISINRLGFPDAARQANAWFYELRNDPSIAAREVDKPVIESFTEWLGDMSRYMPELTTNIQRLFASESVRTVSLVVLFLVIGIIFVRRGGFTSARGFISSPIGWVSLFLFGLIIAGAIWVYIAGWAQTIALVKPLLPVALLVSVVVYFWKPIFSKVKELLGLVAGAWFVNIVLNILGLKLDFANEAPVFGPSSQRVATELTSQWSQAQAMAVTFIVALIVLISLYSNMARNSPYPSNGGPPAGVLPGEPPEQPQNKSVFNWARWARWKKR